jgi:hypothetical protein
MKETIINCPELSKAYLISITKIEMLLTNDVSLFNLMDDLSKGTCLGQVLALARGYLQAENKKN